MARCGCESTRCNCIIDAGENVTVVFDSEAQSYTITSEGGDSPDFITLNISGVASNVAGATLSQGTTGYTIDFEGQISLGETVNLNLHNVGVGGITTFTIDAGKISAIYDVDVLIFVVSSDCTDKVVALNHELTVNPAGSYLPINLGFTGNWEIVPFGGDVNFIVNGGSLSASVTSTAGGCYMAQMSVTLTPV